MFRWSMLLMMAGGWLGMALLCPAQPPGEGDPGGAPRVEKGPKGDKGPKGGGKFGGPKGKAKGFQLGTVLPPHIREQLQLTEEQASAIRELEKEAKGRLDKILTPEQIQIIREARPPMGGSPRAGKDGPGGPGGGRSSRPELEQKEKPSQMGGIQWFSTWNSAKAEAARTGKPILLVSAAPHCAGIPGIW